ncbi:SDR family NAD(P)-dependent oxidoreductase [Sandaracinobacter neustonicus]|uniref:SDR family NAD(P)-dependent oxidoreductase n=1 Tax=Sandaracinobacter neustonicus TaxID=1715348 RepID=A0A501XEY2_9SPHN|nr:SDR family NAD(P)-dependent oxidoreductase [Sandaracinobacter neustonicus]TPE59070.1 SDR family NAD(P)-dependent oxidoreductase [Sandaracinobacter neustonicus]
MAENRQKLALVTGASRGIGAATAIRLGREGYHVILTARSESGLIATEDAIHAEGGSATIAPVDLTKGEDIDKLAAAIAGRWNGLDLLVLNAAMLGTLSPLAHVSPKEFEAVMALNVTAQWRLIRAFDGQLRLGRGTVVAITSSVASRAEAYWGPYAASKAALESLVGVYAAEMQALGVNALIVDPGGTRTQMRAKAFPGEDPQTLKEPEAVADRIAERLQASLPPGLSRIAIARDGALLG